MIQIIDTLITGLSYVNMFLLFFGIIILLKNKKSSVFLLYFTLLVTIEIMALWWVKSIWLLPISCYIHVFFLTLFFLTQKLKVRQQTVLVSLSLLALPLFYELFQGYSKSGYNPFSYLFYDFCIVILMLYILYRNLQESQEKISTPYYLIFITLIYFSVDFIIAVTSNYLINQHLGLVGWIWLFRALCLTLFYVSIVKFSIR